MAKIFGKYLKVKKGGLVEGKKTVEKAKKAEQKR